jgi:hypothetical protein
MQATLSSRNAASSAELLRRGVSGLARQDALSKYALDRPVRLSDIYFVD